MQSYAIGQTGGIVYHLRALRFQNSLWSPFQEWVTDFLSPWKPSGELVLVGSSGGYTLSIKWLKQFDQLTVIEPDPIARAILKIRLGRSFSVSRLTFIKDPLTPVTLDKWNQIFPNATHALFSNVLGQLYLTHSPMELSDFKRAFQSWVSKSRSKLKIASYHDRLSGEAIPQIAALAHESHSPKKGSLSNQDLLKVCYKGQGGELADHEMEGWFPPDFRAKYGFWQISKNVVHLIEGVMA